MATTLEDLIERVRDAAGDLPVRDSLAGSLNDSDTSFALSDGEHVNTGAVLSVGLETIRVIRKGATFADVADSVRGWRGTTKASHSDGAEVVVNPRYTANRIRQAINNALGAIGFAFGKPNWSEGQTFSDKDRLIEVPSDAVHVRGVSENPSSSGTDLKGVPFRRMRSAPTSLISSGQAVRLTGYNPGSGTAYIRYETAWTKLNALDDTLDSEFPEDAFDLIDDGAVAELVDSDLFARIAFSAAHARQGGALTQADSMRLAEREMLGRFLSRRTEVMAREVDRNLAWIKGATP